ncbi:MAG: DoxX family membrane protein [Ignavibacteriales bacterium]|nr:DoxX family membrane protein [Ignavibacteriales bacterium]
MDLLTKKIAKIIYAIPMLAFGIMHFIYADAMTGAVPSFIPGGIFWVYLTGIALVTAAISIVTGILTRPASLLLALMLFIFMVTIHLPGMFSETTRQASMLPFLKDMGLAAGALLIAGLDNKK